MGALYDTYVEVYLKSNKVKDGLKDLEKQLKDFPALEVLVDDTQIRDLMGDVSGLEKDPIDVEVKAEDREVVEAGKSVDQLDQAAQRVANRTIDLKVRTQEIEGARDAFDGLSRTIGGTLMAASAVAVTGGLGFSGMAKAALGMMTQVENANFLLKTYTGSAEAASNVTSELVAYAQSDTGVLFQRGDLLDAAANLAIYGDNVQKITGHVKVMSKGVALGKTSFQELSDILGRVGAAGKLTGQDFDVLVARGIRLDDKMRNAKVTFDEVFAALDKALPAGVLEGRVKSIEGRMIRLKSSFRNLGLQILGVETVVDEFGNSVTRFAEGGAGDKLMKFLEDLAATLRSDEVKAGFAKVGEVMVGLASTVIPLLLKAIVLLANNFDKIIFAVKMLAAAFVAAKLAAWFQSARLAMTKFAASFALASKSIGMSVAAASIWVAVLVGVGLAIKGLYDRSESFRKAIKRLTDAFSKAGGIFEWFGNVASKGIDLFMDTVEKGWNKIAPAVNGIIDFAELLVTGDFKKGMFGGAAEDSKIVDTVLDIREKLGELITFVKETAVAAWEKLGVAVGFAKEKFEEVKTFLAGINIFDGVDTGDVTSKLQNVRDFISDKLIPFFETAKEKLTPAFNLIKDSLVDLGNQLVKTWDSVWKSVGPVWESLTEAAKELWPELQKMWKEVGPALKSLAKVLGGVLLVGILSAIKGLEMWAKVIEKVAPWVSKYIVSMMPYWKMLLKVVIWVIEKIAWYINEIVVPGWKKMWEGAQSLWEKLQPVFTVIGWIIQNVLIPAFKVFWETVKVVWESIKIAISVAWAIIKPIWDSIWSYVTTILIPTWQRIWDVAKTVWDGVWQGVQIAWGIIKPIWDAIWGYISGTLIPAFQKLWTKVQEAWNNISNGVSTVRQMISGAFDVIRNIFQGVIDKAVTFAGKIQTIIDKIKALGKAIGSAPAAAKNLLDKATFWDGDQGATGKTNWKGGNILVGEEGPEIVNLPRGADIIPHKESMQALSGSTSYGGDTVTQNFYGVSDQAIFAQVLAKERMRSRKQFV